MSDPFSPAQLAQLTYPTPFLLTDISRAQQNYQLLQRYFPGVHVHYAMKSNTDHEILKALQAVGSGFEIASYGELELLLAIGVKAEDVLYSNPVKPPDHIKRTYLAGVRYFVFDSVNELDKLAADAPGSKVYLRLKVSDDSSVFPLSSKFGADIEDAVTLMQAAQQRGLQPAGLTFHVGSQSTDPDMWRQAIEACGRLMTRLQQVGITLEFLDMGGGLPVQYVSEIASIEAMARVIQDALHSLLPYQVQLVLEPGRFLSANTGMMVASVIGRERRGNEEWVYLDVGAFQGLIEFLEMPGWTLPITTDAAPFAEMAAFTVTGPTCDAQDTLGHGIMLPKDIKVGDRVYLGQTGAYTLVYAAPSFNGFAPPTVYYVGAPSAPAAAPLPAAQAASSAV